MKKFLAFLSVTALTFTLAACGGGGGEELDDSIEDDPDIDYSEEKLTIWSFTDELKTEDDIEYFEENYTGEGQKYEGMEIEFVEVPTEDYLQTIMPTLRTGDGAPDVFTGELDMQLNYYEGGYNADLEAMMKDDDDLDFDETKDDFVDYIWEAGQDPDDGTLRSLSWQVAPGGIFFKTDMAEAVWGDESGFPSDPDSDDYNDQVSEWVSEEKFDSLQGLIDASEEVKDHDSNWRLFANEDAIRFFADETDDPESWLSDDGLVNPDALESEKAYMDTVHELYDEDLEDSLTANVDEWSGEWYQGIGEDFKTADDKTLQTMAYTLPSWGLNDVLKPNVERVDEDGETCEADDDGEFADDCEPKGNWALGKGPNSYFWGGTYLNIYRGSDMKEPSYDFIKTMLFDTERMEERAENGDTYARKSIMEDVTDDYQGNDILGGMNQYDLLMDEADEISLDYITTYDRSLDELMGDVVNDYKTGEIDTKEEAYKDFYEELQSSYPELYKSEGLPYQD
ncbi:MAG: carbohydrate ABC transporter substrate-binding protein [Bacillota bacterium]